jgi:hypothetical protein
MNIIHVKPRLIVHGALPPRKYALHGEMLGYMDKFVPGISVAYLTSKQVSVVVTF